MALTNFATLNDNQLTAWSRDFWKTARNMSFINQFAGSGSNAMVQRVTELTKSQKGTQAVITLLADMTGDGITGDHQLENNEEALRAYDQVIKIDQLRFANRLAGRLTDQKTVVNFREQSRDALAYAMADRIDQLAFLTLSGVEYTYKNNGGTRPTNTAVAGGALSSLDFAAVTDPTSKRSLVATGTGLDAGISDTLTNATLGETNTLGYRTIVETKAYAKDHYIRGIRSSGNEEIYHMFVTPQQMAGLKLDSEFLANVRNAGVRGNSNSLFSGTSSVLVDGVMIHEFRHVFNTSGAADGSKWGAGSAIDGARALFCGAQALAMADIGLPTIEEETFDYGNQHGISIGKIFGFLKPVYNSDVDVGEQDFGVITLDTAF